ncbi:hypothetical protein AQUCO_00400063v1 [Aquilegia coerulea]|uniref:Uncharacterized protein n=1 Tax=Aquilegia coerulea TaxID=218851 RepID=A0A2G5ETC2_AQUCA|nr:hypothetical protein AQUCO_00400063v1 [Aquilegia coerulea]
MRNIFKFKTQENKVKDMEDSVTDSESLMPHLKVKSSEVVEDQVVKEVNEEEEVGDERDKGSGGGLFNNFISNLVSPKSRDVDEGKVSDGEAKRKREDENHNDGVLLDEGGGGGEGGGVFNNILSNIFHQNGGEDQDKKEDGNSVVVEENKKVKVDKEESGGGIINNIVSNLPISLPG